MKLVTISGLDGSGKSTQIKLLKEYLESQNKRVFYFHAIKFGIANAINNLLRAQKSVDNNKSVIKANLFTILLRKLFLKIDLIRFERLYKKLEQKKFDYILSDRYFYDTVINIGYLSYCHSGRIRQPVKELNNLIDNKIKSLNCTRDDILKPNIAIYLQINPEIIMQREQAPDQGLEYLQKKKELYDRYEEVFNMQIIKGDRNKEEIFEKIKNLLKI